MAESSMHPISEMAMHQQFLTQLAGTDASLFGIDPTLLPSHLAGYHGEDGDEGDDNEVDDNEVGDVERDGVDREAGDIPTPPFFSGELPPSANGVNGNRQMHMQKGRSPPGIAPPSQRISRHPDPRASALMQLVPMPSQLPPGASPTDEKSPYLTSPGMQNFPVDPRYAAPGTAGMMPHAAMMMPIGPHPVGPPGAGPSGGNPADQVGTWTESVNAYWQPMGLPAFQAPVLVNGGLAATIRDARLAWMVGESVCGHPSCLGRRFERKTNLLKHLLTHVEARPYVCQVPGCDQAFKQKWLLDRHGRVHAANKEVHRCPVPGCNTTCSSLYNLRNHELVHSETKKFLCDFENCGRTFATARNLRLHQRTHTGDKPFACDYPNCGMRYHRPAHLKRHQEVHNGDREKSKGRKGRSGGANATATGSSSSTGRKKKIATELENEIDELAGDGGPDDVVAARARPKRAAAIAAAANSRKRWDQDLDLGDEEAEEEEDEDDEDENDSKMHEDDDEDDEDEEEDEYDSKGKGTRRTAPIISSSGGPQYGANGAVPPYSNARGSYGMMLVSTDGKVAHPNAMGMPVHPNMLVHGIRRQDEDMDDASPGVAPAAEGDDEE